MSISQSVGLSVGKSIIQLAEILKAEERLTFPLACYSIIGHGVPYLNLEFKLMMYSATKNGVQVLTEGECVYTICKAVPAFLASY